MSLADLRPPTIEELLRDQEQVIARQQALCCGLSSAQLAWLVSSGRWQRPFPRAYVAHNGPLTTLQWAWAGWASAWPDGVLCCHTAAALDELRGFERPEVHVMTFLERQVTKQPLLVPHRSSYAGDIHPLRAPARTRLPRSLVDMTTHADSIDDATAILAAGVQQRLVPARLLRQELERQPTLRWRAELLAVCDDLAGGSHSLIEVEAMRLLRRYHLRLPSRQVRLTLPDGLARVDCLWDDYSVVAELDGRMHMDPLQWIADLDRQNELTLGSRIVLRYPLWALRHHHARVADQLRRALTAAGWPGV